MPEKLSSPAWGSSLHRSWPLASRGRWQTSQAETPAAPAATPRSCWLLTTFPCSPRVRPKVIKAATTTAAATATADTAGFISRHLPGLRGLSSQPWPQHTASANAQGEAPGDRVDEDGRHRHRQEEDEGQPGQRAEHHHRQQGHAVVGDAFALQAVAFPGG